jgi:hypothetical protein
MKGKKRFFKTAGFVFLAVFLIAGCAGNQGDLGSVYRADGSGGSSGGGTSGGSGPLIRVVNNTGYPIEFIFMQGAGLEFNNENGLGEGEVLPEGGYKELRLPVPLSRVDRYFFMFIDDAGYSYMTNLIQLSAGAEVVFTPENFEAKIITRSGDPNLPEVTIVNNTGDRIVGGYIRPSSTPAWGGSILGGRSLNNGQSLTVRLARPLSEESVYDVRLTDADDRRDYVKTGVQIQNGVQIVLTRDDFRGR